MLDLTRKGEVMAQRQRGDDREGNRDDMRAEFIQRLVLGRCPELSADEIAAAFADAVFADAAFADDAADANASVLVEIADAVNDAIEALEERLDELERGLPWRVH
jgi:hypothetical protein